MGTPEGFARCQKQPIGTERSYSNQSRPPISDQHRTLSPRSDRSTWCIGEHTSNTDLTGAVTLAIALSTWITLFAIDRYFGIVLWREVKMKLRPVE